MSYVGEPFDYDVFVSYAHAEVETKAPLIRNWSRRVAEQLRDLLASAPGCGRSFGLRGRGFPRRPRAHRGTTADADAARKGQAFRSAARSHEPALSEQELVHGRARLVLRTGERGRPRPGALPVLLDPARRGASVAEAAARRARQAGQLSQLCRRRDLPARVHRRSGLAATPPGGAEAIHRDQGKAGCAAQAARCAAANDGRRNAATRRPSGHLPRCEPRRVGALGSK